MLSSSQKNQMISRLKKDFLARCVEIDAYLSQLDNPSYLSTDERKIYFDTHVRPKFLKFRDNFQFLLSSDLSLLDDQELVSLSGALGQSYFHDVAERVQLCLAAAPHSQTYISDLKNLEETLDRQDEKFFCSIDTAANWFVSVADVIKSLQMRVMISVEEGKKTTRSLESYLFKFDIEARWYFAWGLVVSVLLGVFVYFVYCFYVEGFAYVLDIGTFATDIPSNKFYLLMSKNLFIGVVFLGGIYNLFKILAILLHNFIILREKRLALSVFDKFNDAQSEAIRTEAALTAIRTVLISRESGVLKPIDLSSGAQIADITNAFADLIKAKQ